ncbi:phage infection protein [Lacticaseibacillus suibinensis]|uniref:phage infection protein n=1 Tax=Lacticaseibacillus suibinensis TaxID=2486011 RepID=UPI000F793A17|nr:phage infection protein [Lacticaseibacillus suibinensis]
METKERIRALFTLDSDGYIIGYQREFFDGKEWQTPFDTTNAVEVAPGDLDTIVMGATKLRNGKLVVDEAKQAELEQPVTPQPTAEQQLIATLMLKVAKLEASA